MGGREIAAALAAFPGPPGAQVAALSAVALCAVAPSLNPVHIGGALLLANDLPENEKPTFTRLLWHAGTATAVVPGVATLAATPFIL